MQGKRLIQGLIATLITTVLVFWLIGAIANGDPVWFVRNFSYKAQMLVLYWDGQRYEFNPNDEAYPLIMDAAAKAIGDYGGYESGVVFSEININRYRDEWRMLELRFPEAVQIHSRYDIRAANTYFIPLNYTHANYRRVFTYPENTTFCISAVNMTLENKLALEKAIEEALLIAQIEQQSSTSASVIQNDPSQEIEINSDATSTGVAEVEGSLVSPTSYENNPVAIEKLAGLDIDTFFTESWFMLLARDPEYITEAGLSEIFGMKDDQLTDLSPQYIAETQQLELAIYEMLLYYKPEKLTETQARSWRIYKTWLEDAIDGHEFTEYDYPISQFIYSVHYSTEHFFTEIHPITSRQLAEAYLTRLSQIETKFTQVIDGLERREENGILLPKFLIQWTLPDIRSMASHPAKGTIYYITLRDRLTQVPDLSADDRNELLSRAALIIEDSVQPAYRDLEQLLAKQLEIATNDAGVWKFPGGDRYYAYRLHHYTTTEMTASDIHELGLAELERIHAEMRNIFDELGYPENETIPQLYKRVAQDGGFISGSSAKDKYETIINEAASAVAPVFDVLPKAGVIVIEDRFGGFYVPPAFDGSRPGAFYASTDSTLPYYRMPSLAYHETIPGHHLQIALAQELPNPPFQQGSLFTVHAEGWALYAEQLAWEVGLYDDDPYGNLGRLQYEAHRAARLVVDTGIHAYQWTYDQAVDTLVDATGMPEQNAEYEVARYIVLPGQACAYEIGMLEIMRLRDLARDELGNSFEITEFHNAVLGSGSVPLSELALIVEGYIEKAH